MGKNMININDINNFLTPELCEDAGIIVINISDKSLDLGAMNLDYIKVKNVIKTIESDFKLQVSLKQITSLEWETWFENTHATSVETIQKSSIQNQERMKAPGQRVDWPPNPSPKRSLPKRCASDR